MVQWTKAGRKTNSGLGGGTDDGDESGPPAADGGGRHVVWLFLLLAAGLEHAEVIIYLARQL